MTKEGPPEEPPRHSCWARDRLVPRRSLDPPSRAPPRANSTGLKRPLCCWLPGGKRGARWRFFDFFFFLCSSVPVRKRGQTRTCTALCPSELLIFNSMDHVLCSGFWPTLFARNLRPIFGLTPKKVTGQARFLAPWPAARPPPHCRVPAPVDSVGRQTRFWRPFLDAARVSCCIAGSPLRGFDGMIVVRVRFRGCRFAYFVFAFGFFLVHDMFTAT